MTIAVIPYESQLSDAWDALCAGAANSTFLHTRRFLQYHGERFEDKSVMLMRESEFIACLPAAVSRDDASMVVSHPGITYGGVVHNGELGGAAMIDALESLREHFRHLGYARLRYKAIPYLYQVRPSQDDLYALFRIGALRSRCDLSCTIDLANRPVPSQRRRRGLKKALKCASVKAGPEHITALWAVLEDNLGRKHAAKPVHSLKEIQMLVALFPDSIELFCAEIEGQVEAGVVLFKSRTAWHAQYIAASEKAYAVSALDAVFDRCISEAAQSGARYFDFGTSNEAEGTVLNESLYQYKHEYGGGGLVHEYYDIDLLGV